MIEKDFIYQNPIFLLLLIIPVLGVWYFVNKGKENEVNFRLPTLQSVTNYYNWKTILIKILPYLRLFSLLLIILAMARPQKVWQDEDIKADGIDIALVMDISLSMMAQDFSPDRLEVSKQVAANFVENRQFDRFSLTLFAGEAYSPCPLTTDHRIVKEILSKVQCEFIQKKGTSIGMGLASGINRIKDSEAKSKIIILLTDGANKPSYIQPDQATEIAKQMGIKIYTIGIGTEQEVLMPIGQQPNGEYAYGYVQAEFDEPLLIKIAENTGGRYFKASDRNSLEQIYKIIDKLEKTPLQINTMKREKDMYHKYLFVALGLFLFEFVMRRTVLKSIT